MEAIGTGKLTGTMALSYLTRHTTAMECGSRGKIYALP